MQCSTSFDCNCGKQNLNLSYSWKVWRECNFTLYVLMNDIPIDLVFQTSIQIIPTGEWTMHQASHKLVPITHSDDKLQITGVLTVTATGKCFFPRLIYKGKTVRCHPKLTIPTEWDIWHSENHWSTEETMIRYIEKVIFQFVEEERAELKLLMSYLALAIFDCFNRLTAACVGVDLP